MVTCRHTAWWFKLGEDFPNPGEYNRLLLETFKKYINPVETMIKSMQVLGALFMFMFMLLFSFLFSARPR